VGESSVVIAVSSVHRKDSLGAVQWCIDELKATVPVWKKEVYEDGSAWKANAECAGCKGSGHASKPSNEE
jgi:molybdopterin synthase catalytic subunit